MATLTFLTRFFFAFLVFFTVSRLLIVTVCWQRVEQTNKVSAILLGGLRIDIALIAQVIVLPVFAYALARWHFVSAIILKYSIVVWVIAISIVFVTIEISSVPFIQEFDVRPNRLFIEYLSDIQPIFDMLMASRFWQLVLSLVLTTILTVLFIRWMKLSSFLNSENIKLEVSSDRRLWIKSLSVNIVLLLVLIIGARSGLQHRPINPAMVAVTSDRLVNSIVLNSPYSVTYAAYRLMQQKDIANIYPKMPVAKMYAVMNNQLGRHLSPEQEKEKSSFFEFQKARQNFQEKDLIIVVQESLGARFVGSLGGMSLTPNIDQWSNKSWFFEQLYATGIRSARGLEAITTGFLPTATQAVLKRPKAQEQFFTLASLLKSHGYKSTFIYGGESHFDNMRGFFLNNGFDHVIDQRDYQDPAFVGSWGVSDEDLFNKALSLIRKPSDSPRFFLIFSSSNHEPFQFPDGRVTVEGNKNTVQNAIKYADYALGQFLDQLEAEARLDRTTLIVVADHDARVKGSSLVPVDRFRIPGFIIDKDIEPRKDSRLISQIDLLPTLISVLGVDASMPTFGVDLLSTSPDRAMMQYGENFAYMTPNNTVFLQPNKLPLLKEPSKQNATQLIDIAVAYARLGEWMYQNEFYQTLP